MKYLAQAILHDGNIETIVDSFKTDDPKATLDFMMKRHRFSYDYQYVVMEISTKEIIINTTRNHFWL